MLIKINNIPEFVYHTTHKDNLSSILSKGLIPDNKYDKEDGINNCELYVFTSRDPENLWDVGEEFITIQIKTDNYEWFLDPNMLEHCPEYYENDDLSWVNPDDYQYHWSIVTKSHISINDITILNYDNKRKT